MNSRRSPLTLSKSESPSPPDTCGQQHSAATLHSAVPFPSLWDGLVPPIANNLLYVGSRLFLPAPSVGLVQLRMSLGCVRKEVGRGRAESRWGSGGMRRWRGCAYRWVGGGRRGEPQMLLGASRSISHCCDRLLILDHEALRYLPS